MRRLVRQWRCGDVGTCLTYLLVAVEIVLVVGAHAGVGVVTPGVGRLTRVQASHHPGVEI